MTYGYGGIILGFVAVFLVGGFWAFEERIARLFGWKPGGKIENHKPACLCDRCVEAREVKTESR